MRSNFRKGFSRPDCANASSGRMTMGHSDFRHDLGSWTVGARRIRREQRQIDMAESRRVNGMDKDKERVRRDSRMLGLVKQGKMPYTPGVLSWLSVKLDKPAGRI